MGQLRSRYSSEHIIVAVFKMSVVGHGIDILIGIVDTRRAVLTIPDEIRSPEAFARKHRMVEIFLRRARPGTSIVGGFDDAGTTYFAHLEAPALKGEKVFYPKTVTTIGLLLCHSLIRSIHYSAIITQGTT